MKAQHMREVVPMLMNHYSAREAALEVYSCQMVPGAPEWLQTGDERHLPRTWRPLLGVAAERIARVMSRTEPARS